MAIERHVERRNGVAIIVTDHSDSYRSDMKVTARSKKHAEKLAERLDWYTWSRGPGQQYSDLWYNSRAKRLEYTVGWDV